MKDILGNTVKIGDIVVYGTGKQDFEIKISVLTGTKYNQWGSFHIVLTPLWKDMKKLEHRSMHYSEKRWLKLPLTFLESDDRMIERYKNIKTLLKDGENNVSNS